MSLSSTRRLVFYTPLLAVLVCLGAHNAFAQAVGVQVYNANGTGAQAFAINTNWSAWTYAAPGSTNIDGASVQLSVPTAFTKDFRYCIQAASGAGGSVPYSNPSTAGTAQCSPWASSGGGWSPFATAKSGSTSSLRVKFETRNWPSSAAMPTHMRVGIQAKDSCPGEPFPVAFSAEYSAPISVTSGGDQSTPFAVNVYGGVKSGTAGCFRIFLSAENNPPSGDPAIPQIGIQALRTDNSTAGAAVFTSETFLGWSQWATAPGSADIDRARVFVRYTPQTTNRKDMRFCLQVANATSEAESNAQCTSWMSEGVRSGYATGNVTAKTVYGITNWALPASGSDPNYLRVRAETRPMPATFPSVIGLGLSIRAAESRTCADYPGDMEWASTREWPGGNFYLPWSLWATDSSGQGAPEPDCYRLQYEGLLEDLPAFNVSFSASKTTITSGESIMLNWSSTGANSCTAVPSTAFPTGNATSGQAGPFTLYEPTTYSLSCTSTYPQEGTYAWQKNGPFTSSQGAACSTAGYVSNTCGTSGNPEGASCSTSGATCTTVWGQPGGAFCSHQTQSWSCAAVTNSVTRSVTIAVNPPVTADLTATASAISGMILPNSSITLAGNIRNDGNGEARGTGGGNFPYTFKVTGPESKTIALSTTPLAANSVRSFTAQTSVSTAGAYQYQLCADQNASGSGLVAESNEGNNCSSWQSFLVDQPPPAYLTLTALPFIVKKDNQTSFTWHAENVQQGSCTIQPKNVPTYGSGTLNEDGQTDGTWYSNPIPSRGYWVLSCTDLMGSTVESNQIEIRLLAGFSEF